MRNAGRIKKLVLIPTILMTAFLAFAFLRPATAARVLGVVAPALGVVPSTVSESGGPGLSVPGSTGGSSTSQNASVQGGGRPATSTGAPTNPSQDSTNPSEGQPATGHSISTPARENCGRFGNGSHGAKHFDVCPNQPYPQPAF